MSAADGPALLVLGFDTSVAACRVALTSGDDLLAHHVEEMARGQTERLMVLIADVLEAQAVAPDDLSAIAVGTGPGNFTGIRIAVSAARGMALGLGVPAIGVSAFEALREGHRGPCACAVPSRGDGIYLQRFGSDGTTFAPEVCTLEACSVIKEPLIGAGGAAPAYPTAEAICRVAVRRFSSPQPRPAPLYIRAADAAPARDAPPKILP